MEAAGDDVGHLREEGSLEVVEAEVACGKAADVAVEDAVVGIDALLAEDAVGGVRVPAPEQLALLLEDEPVQLRVQGHHHRLPHQTRLEHRTVPAFPKRARGVFESICHGKSLAIKL